MSRHDHRLIDLSQAAREGAEIFIRIAQVRDPNSDKLSEACMPTHRTAAAKTSPPSHTTAAEGESRYHIKRYHTPLPWADHRNTTGKPVLSNILAFSSSVLFLG